MFLKNLKSKGLLHTIKCMYRSRTVHLNTYVFLIAAGAVLVFPQVASYLNNISIALLAVANIFIRTKTVGGLFENAKD